MIYVLAGTGYTRLVEDLSTLILDLAAPTSIGEPIDVDWIKMTPALAGGVCPHAAALDPHFDWCEALPARTEARQ